MLCQKEIKSFYTMEVKIGLWWFLIKIKQPIVVLKMHLGVIKMERSKKAEEQECVQVCVPEKERPTIGELDRMFVWGQQVWVCK